MSELEEIYESLYYGLGIAELGIFGVMLMAAIIGAIISAVVSFITTLIIWLVEAFPTYKLAKKVGCNKAFLAWIPILGNYFRMYVLVTMVEDTPFELFGGKIKIENRSLSFWLYVAISYFGVALITALVSLLTVIPVIGTVIGSISSLLYLLPPVVTGLMEYVYLKDVLDLFKEDKKSNSTASIVVTVLDSFVTFGLARAIFLCTMLKTEPLPKAIKYY